MKNLKSFLIIATLALVTTSANVSFANNVNVKKIVICTATVSGTSSDGVTYTVTATRSTCSEALGAARRILQYFL